MKNFGLLAIMVISFFSCTPNKEKVDKQDKTIKKDQENAKIPEKMDGVEIKPKGDERYLLNFNEISIEVDAKDGARISSLSLDGQEVLSLEDVNDMNWGSTFWSSPQSEWGWPPPASFDRTPYDVKIHDNHITATSKIDSLTGYSFEKEVYINTEDTSVAINYRITNNNDTVKSVAPWEITRVPPDGLTFYAGEPNSYKAPFTVVDSLGYVWFDYVNSTIQKGHDKLIGKCSKGWIAHVKDNVILLKVFEHKEDYKFAPGEGEVEIYASPDKKYIEIEPQGPYVSLNPGESLEWKLKWVLKKVPKNASANVGNKELIDYVELIAKRDL